ncbi:MAG TPA: cache domain-containing protein, partial [Burkholderiales bacterium]|nr:cache domain-containing protein [Burkholderiales bacterium]
MRKLAFVIAAAMVPAALLAVVLIGYDYYDRERSRLIRDSTATARALSAAVDTELTAVKAALFALATSPHLGSGDMAAFHAQAAAAMKDQTFVNVILSDRSGRQLLNTFRKFGEPLPAQGDPGGLLRVFETGAPVVSDLFQGRLTQSYIIGIGVPVRHDGAVRFGLSAGLAPERLTELLRQQRLPPGWIAAVLDRRGTIVARTHDARRLVGQQGSSEL